MLNEFTSGEIYIRHAIDTAPSDTEFFMHIHEGCEIFFFVSGSIEYLVEGSRYSLPENSIMIMRPSEAHRAQILNSVKYERYAINFPLSHFNTIDPEGRLVYAFTSRPLGQDNLFTSDELDTLMLKRFFEAIFEAGDEYERTLSLNTHLPLILNMIYRAFSSRTKNEKKPLSVSEQIVAYVNSHLFEKISIPELAKCFYLSSSQFSRLFKQATGSSPWEYIVRKRLAFAKEKIRSGSTMQAACESCGFSDYSSFYRAYTKYYSHAPINDSGE